MDPMKSRRWIAAAALAAAVVFLVMITGQHGPATPGAASAQVSQSGAVLSSDGGPPRGSGDDGADNGGGDNGGDGAGAGEAADREEVIDALQGLLDALGVSADELADGAAGCNGGQEESGAGNGAGRSGEKAQEKDEGCERSGQSSADRSADATIKIAGFAFGQPLTVEPGATVEVVNTDAAPHNVTASDKSFETPDLNQDETATFTAPSTPGRYEFTCTLHPEMTGTLVVEGAGSEQSRSRSSEPGSGRAGAGHEGSQQHSTTAPDRTKTGTDGGY
jgi:plastocyanin